MTTIVQVTTPSEIRHARELMREFTSWAMTLEEGSEQAPTFRGLEEELATLPGIYAPPTGCLLLAMQDDRPAGCVALKPHDPTTGELKRLYVRSDFRGSNLGRQLVAALIDEARKFGYRRIILDSHVSMTRAHEIYRAAGFRDVDAPERLPRSLQARGGLHGIDGRLDDCSVGTAACPAFRPRSRDGHSARHANQAATLIATCAVCGFAARNRASRCASCCFASPRKRSLT